MDTGTPETKEPRGGPLPALIVVLAAGLVWFALSYFQIFPSSSFPSPADVGRGFVEKVRSGTLLDDIVASLFRVTSGFVLAVGLGLPVGLWLGLRARVRRALLPAVNFFRSLSPLAWIPFAILWFGIGDVPSIFLIFMTAFFPMVLATSAAVASIRIARTSARFVPPAADRIRPASDNVPLCQPGGLSVNPRTPSGYSRNGPARTRIPRQRCAGLPQLATMGPDRDRGRLRGRDRHGPPRLPA